VLSPRPITNGAVGIAQAGTFYSRSASGLGPDWEPVDTCRVRHNRNTMRPASTTRQQLSCSTPESVAESFSDPQNWRAPQVEG
jgi:hypothetical protein